MLPTCDLYDLHGPKLSILPTGLTHFGGHRSFHGPAMTIKTHEVNSHVWALARTPGEGRVMVVDGGGSDRHALMGDKLAATAAQNGWAGAVFWGAVRDIAELARTPIGVMAIARTPARCLRKDEGETGLDITIEGVTIRPGDMVIADEDGVVIAPAGLL